MSVEIPQGWCFRHGTNDREIWRCVVECDEYRMKDRKFTPEDIVLDVGAHIGCFSYLAWTRGATVRAFETNRESYELHRINTWRYAGIVRHNWCIFPEGMMADFVPSDDDANTGGGDVLGYKSGCGMRTVPLYSTMGRDERIRLAKFDCEYSEFPILLTSDLSRIDEIVGEYHEIPSKRYPEIPYVAQVPGVTEFSRDVLRECLERQGFTVEINHEAENIGKFFAVRV